MEGPTVRPARPGGEVTILGQDAADGEQGAPDSSHEAVASERLESRRRLRRQAHVMVSVPWLVPASAARGLSAHSLSHSVPGRLPYGLPSRVRGIGSDQGQQDDERPRVAEVQCLDADSGQDRDE